MKSATQCLQPSDIEALLAGTAQASQCELWEEHFSSCESCRMAMASLVGDQEWWREAEQSLQQHVGESLRDSELRLGETDLRELADERESIEGLLKRLGPTDDPKFVGRIGSYEVLGVLGRGGMGVVFKAFDAPLNRFVAIKMLLPHLAASGAARKRFAREAQAVAAVVDDHVMAIHCVDEWQGVPYLVMTYSRGITLQKRLSDNGPLEVREILRIGMQAARGLAAAHAQGIVHRDIKPANIFLDQNVERVQLMDFGLARAVDDASLTRTGVLAGTPQYMSPEQARAETVDHRSDLFSLGSVMYAMCTGHAPFRAESSYSVLRLITDKEPRPIREINPDVPDWLCLLISRLMSKSLDGRYANALEVADLLGQCLAHVQQPTSAPLPASLVPHATAGRSVFNSTRTGIMTMLGIVGMTLLGMVLWQTTEPPDISGQWTSDEWGTVVLEAKEPGQYEGTFGGNDKTSNPTTGNLPPEKEPLTAWGKEVGGLQAGLGLDYGNRRTYGHGEVITLVVRLRNVGKEAVKFRYPRQDLYENLAVTDADGEAVPQCNTKFMPPNDPESENLEPGREIVLKTRMHGSNGVPFVLIPSNSEDLELNENFRPLVVGIGKVQLQIEKVFGTFSFDFPKLSTGTLELEVNNQPGGAEFSGSSSEIHPAGSPRASGVPPRSNKGESGTLHLKWSRVERRFNGTWGVGENRNGRMSLRLVGNEIRGGFTTDKESQLTTGTPLIGDLLWRRRIVDDSGDSNHSVVSYGVGDLVEGGDGAPQSSVRAETLVELIKTVVNPDSWDDERVSISFEPLKNNGLFINHEPEVHVKIQQLLKSIRKLQTGKQTNAAVAIKEGETSLKSNGTFKFQRAIEERLLVAKIRNAQLKLEREKAFENPDAEKLKELRTTLEAAEAEYKQYQTLSENHGSPEATDSIADLRGATRSVVTVPDGGNVELGGLPQPVLSNVTLAERSATVVGVGGDDLDCVLRIAKSKRNEQLEWTTSVNGHFSATVTATTDRLPSDDGQLIRGIVLTIQDSKKSSTTSIGMSDGDQVPAGAVKFRQVSAMDRADTMVTFADIHCDDGTTIPISILLRSNKQHNKMAIDEAFRAHKVPNVRWLDASGNQQDGTVPTGPAQPPTPANTDDSALSVVDETLKSLIESLKPLHGDWVVEFPGAQFYPTDKLGDSAVSHFVMRIRTNHVELRPFPHSGAQPVTKLLLHPIQDAKPGHFLVDTDPSAVDQQFSPGEFSFEVQENQLHVKLIPAKSSESNRPDQGSEAPKGFSAHRETEGFSARRATDEEQRKFAQDRLQHMRMVGYKNADRTNPEAVVEAYVAASLAGDVTIATSLAEGYAARPDQSTGWNKHWNLNDFAIKSVRVRGQVVTPMRVTAKEAIVVSELMHRTSPATIGDVSVGHHVTFLKNINGKWVVSAFDLWTAEHYNKGIGNFLNADGEATGVASE